MKKLVPKDSILIPDGASKVFAGEIFGVYQWPQRLYDGSSATFEMLKRADTVNAICVLDDKIIVIEDEQPNRSAHKTFPGGRVDPNDASVLAAAKREVLEEVGYSFKQWRLVEVAQPLHKLEWFTYLFLAWDLAGQEKVHLDAGERISLSMVDFAGLRRLVMNHQGTLGEYVQLFENLHDLDDLLALPEYEGREVDR